MTAVTTLHGSTIHLGGITLAKEVDWEERRIMVAKVVYELIAEAGIEGLTVRDIARRAGFSTAVTSHYFKNKRELLLFAYKESARAIGADAWKDGETHSLQKALENFLPIDSKRQQIWKVNVAFWGKAITDPDFLAVHKRFNRKAVSIIQKLIEEATDLQFPISREQAALEAPRLLAAIVGASTLAILESPPPPASHLKGLLKDEIERLQLAAQAAQTGSNIAEGRSG